MRRFTASRILTKVLSARYLDNLQLVRTAKLSPLLYDSASTYTMGSGKSLSSLLAGHGHDSCDDMLKPVSHEEDKMAVMRAKKYSTWIR